MITKNRFLAMMALILLTNVLFAQVNLITNPGFEQNTGELPDGWGKSAWFNTKDVTEYIWVSDEVHSGSHAMLIKSSKVNDARLTFPAHLSKGKKYKFSCWMKTKNMGKEGKGVNLSLINKPSPVEINRVINNWEEFTIYIVLNDKEDADVELCMGIGDYSNMSKGMAWFDDASLVEVDKVPAEVPDVLFIEAKKSETEKSSQLSDNLLNNPGFEQGSDELPNSWKKSAWDDKDKATEVIWLNDQSHSGSRCILIKNNKPNDSRIIQGISLGLGKKYQFSCWIKTENISSEGSGAIISVVSHLSPLEGKKGTIKEWQEVMIYISVNDKREVYPELSIGIGDYSIMSTGMLWIDDAKLIEVDSIPADASNVVFLEERKIQFRFDAAYLIVGLILLALIALVFTAILKVLKGDNKPAAKKEENVLPVQPAADQESVENKE